MSILGISAALSFFLALVLGATALLTPVAALHVAFALGIVPLIFGAMQHFIPVLTRTGAPHRLITALPFAAQVTGVGVVLSIENTIPRILLHPLALLELLFALILLCWMYGRARRCIGSPHPGWRWYSASLCLFMLAIVAIPFFISGIAPAAARLIHLHANPLGFIGLAALGTLPVLMPTVLRKADPQSAQWLRHALLPASASVVLIVMGSAFFNSSTFTSSLALAGATLLLACEGHLLVRWMKNLGLTRIMRNGAASGFLLALLMHMMLLLAGVGHALEILTAEGVVPAFMAGFLLPLVSSALSELLPVWRFPGVDSPKRAAMRTMLMRLAYFRLLLFMIASAAFLAAWFPLAWATLAGGLLFFLADLIAALRVTRASG